MNFYQIQEKSRDPEDFIEFVTRVEGIGKWIAEINIAKVSSKFYIGSFGDLTVRRGFESSGNRRRKIHESSSK